MDTKRYRAMRHKLKKHIGWGQLTLLAILVVTLINQLMLMLGINYHFLFSAAMPYYLNWLARQLYNGPFRVIATIVTLVLYGFYALSLIRSHQRLWFRTGMILYALDTVLLIVFALLLLENPLSCLLELLVHGFALLVMLNSWQARRRLVWLQAKAPKT